MKRKSQSIVAVRGFGYRQFRVFFLITKTDVTSILSDKHVLLTSSVVVPNSKDPREKSNVDLCMELVHKGSCYTKGEVRKTRLTATRCIGKITDIVNQTMFDMWIVRYLVERSKNNL